MDGADAAALLCGHQILTDVGIACAAAAQLIQIGIEFIGIGIELAFIKFRLISVQLHIGAAAVVRQVRHRINGGSGILRSTLNGSRLSGLSYRLFLCCQSQDELKV